MIQIYLNNELTYDSRLEEYDLIGLTIIAGLNKGGTAEIAMPHSHPCYNSYKPFQGIVEIYRDGDLRFRGRPIYDEVSIQKTKTVYCEGELCFLQDAVMSRYTYQGSPQHIFELMVAEYNNQVNPEYMFELGDREITTPSSLDFVSEEAEPMLDTVGKLVERCGGYIVFTTNAAGKRVINWRQPGTYENSQVIEFGESLLDLSISSLNTELATRIYPYGARKATGGRVDIRDVNRNREYITRTDLSVPAGTVFAESGNVISRAVVWDDVTDPAELLAKAKAHLEWVSTRVTSLTVTALDLSYIDKSIESFKIGDLIRVISPEHELDQYFELVECTEDLLNPAGSTITLGKERRLFTSLSVKGDSQTASSLNRAVATVSGGIQQTQSQFSDYAKLSDLSGYATTGALEALEKRIAALEK